MSSAATKVNKSQQYAAYGRRTPFPWLLCRHSKVAAVLSVMKAGDLPDSEKDIWRCCFGPDSQIRNSFFLH